MTREGDVIGAVDERLKVLGVCDLVVYVDESYTLASGEKRTRKVPKIMGRVVHAAPHVVMDTVEEW